MARVYDHKNHCYKYGSSALERTIDNGVSRLSKKDSGVHGHPIGEKQPSGLYVWALVAFLGMAWLTSKDGQAEEVRYIPKLSPAVQLCVMGVGIGGCDD
jgi:hypothetical protein